ncbi:pyruvate dehydrogenase kinase [Eremomyces bilateralis CBS 781.70]|uniref:Protein-serine/threonine kinase n=1 Tax=Eremomyces bilateralis CBS 781.70 TaxID=1392243 RepID=A0A6G1G785_9PEZI|nr:pyruvate dehydrogenase kinase [Eremomyces bilateralis CBS 781.70]KAF1813872.1 pyruvate dehydrogenase kinase [Eremomyces bilateralis CBS 781.70]
MLALRPATGTRNGLSRTVLPLTSAPQRCRVHNAADKSPQPPRGPMWRPSTVLDDWVQQEARPISLRQLTFFGRTLTESRLISSANYVRTELPLRISHRIRDMQTLPYVVLTNDNLSHVYELYYKAFDKLRRIPEVKTVEENDRFCDVIKGTLGEHLSVIPHLAMGVLEIQGLMKPEETDKFMLTLLRSRISRRVIAEQHLALSETFHSPWHFPDAKDDDHSADFVGEVFLRCNAKEVVEQCATTTRSLMQQSYGSEVAIPEVKIEGHTDATFPYILSHLQYIVGELLRNSFQAVTEQRKHKESPPPPIEVLICDTAQHVIIRISDQGGGVPREILPYLWSFSKGPRRRMRLENLNKVPKLAATLQELRVDGTDAEQEPTPKPFDRDAATGKHPSSLSTLTARSPDLRLGIGLPMSRIYAEYWAGSLELHSLEGYGVDAFLQIPKLGNKNERLTTRASMNAV